jgi:hypothetical protein
MLENADRELRDFTQYLSERGLEAAFLVPTDDAFSNLRLNTNISLAGYLRREGIHDYSTQSKGGGHKVSVATWIVSSQGLMETRSLLYRDDVGAASIWVDDLRAHAAPGNLLAFFAHNRELYVLNTSRTGALTLHDAGSNPIGQFFERLFVARNKPLDDRFSEWNLRLLRGFFSEASRDEEVFLTVDKHLLDQIGQDIGGDAGFLAAVRKGTAQIDLRDGLAAAVVSLVTQRKSRPSQTVQYFKEPGDFDLSYRGSRAPAYLPYLALLVRNDTEHPSSYYEGLKKDLGLTYAFDGGDMQLIEQAWSDLQMWTRETGGRFGKFTLRTLGGYNRIGVPRSQSILHRSDIEALPHAFVAAEILPGGEPSDMDVTRVLDEARAAPRLFSAGFRNALESTAFYQPVRAALRAAYADWDGTIPRKRDNDGPSSGPSTGRTELTGAIELCLHVNGYEPLEIAPRWRAPPIQDAGHFRLLHSGNEWEGEFIETDGATTADSPQTANLMWDLAARSCQERTDFDLLCFASGDPEPTRASLMLLGRTLWIFRPEFGGPGGGIELREGDLPAAGPAYLLAPPSNVVRLRSYLLRESPAHTFVSAHGLPSDWLLIWLHDCASLTAEQRLLPDGEEGPHPRPRMIRFSGGRSIRRGYSTMYLPYDLPWIELDAENAISLEPSDGLLVEEIIQDDPFHQAPERFLPRRRFSVTLPHSNSSSYDLTAVDAGQVVGRAKLRVAGLGGELVDTTSAFSIDSMGRPTRAREGLSGVLPSSLAGSTYPPSREAGLFPLGHSDLGIVASWPLKLTSREYFLDALAQAGSMDYGVARNLIRRLLLGSEDELDPPLFLYELRSRGQIEIATTQKGHMARIHSVPPTIYTLPSTHKGKRVYSVTGTLRTIHWQRIVEERHAWVTYRDDRKFSSTRVLRLVSINDSLVEDACRKLGVRMSIDPAAAIATWSSSAAAVERESFEFPMESIGAAESDAKRFNASKGSFSAVKAHNMIELWRLRDLDTRLDNLYVLAKDTRFAFIRDSRWGIWIALNAFARWATEVLRLDGVSPPPLTYDRRTGTVWLPARLSLPFVLERALILCNGDAPRVVTALEVDAEASENHLTLRIGTGEAPSLIVNCFYRDMGKGKWLGYPNVPEHIAKTVSERLGASLDAV